MYQKFKIVYFGTPEFSVPTLQLLFHHPLIELLHVVSMPDRPAGRGQQLKTPEVISYCKQEGIPFTQTENINKELELLQKFKDAQTDMFIVLAFAQFLSSKTLSIPKIGPFNIHTSLLPKYRGAAPIQYALLHGDASTGVSIQEMVKEMDAGDLVCEEPCLIYPYDNVASLSRRLSFLAAECCAKFIHHLFEGSLTRTKQVSSLATFAPTIKKEDGLLDFENDSADLILNKLRAFTPWPGTYTFLNGKRLKVFSMASSDKALGPGEVSFSKDHFTVGTKNRALSFLMVQLEGKKACMMKELLNGLKPPYLLSKE